MNPARYKGEDYIGFLRLELPRLIIWISWYEAKLMIIRPSIASYLKNPLYKLSSTA